MAATAFLNRSSYINRFPTIATAQSIGEAISLLTKKADLDCAIVPLGDLASTLNPALGDWARNHYNQTNEKPDYLVRPFDVTGASGLAGKLAAQISRSTKNPLIRDHFPGELENFANLIEKEAFGTPIRRVGVAGLMSFNPHIDEFITPGYAIIGLVAGQGGTLVWPRSTCNYEGFESIYRDTQRLDRVIVSLRQRLDAGSLAEQVAVADKLTALQLERLTIVRGTRKLVVSDSPFQVPDGFGVLIRTGIGGTLHSCPALPSAERTAAEYKRRVAVILDFELPHDNSVRINTTNLPPEPDAIDLSRSTIARPDPSSPKR